MVQSNNTHFHQNLLQQQSKLDSQLANRENSETQVEAEIKQQFFVSEINTRTAK